MPKSKIDTMPGCWSRATICASRRNRRRASLILEQLRRARPSPRPADRAACRARGRPRPCRRGRAAARSRYLLSITRGVGPGLQRRAVGRAHRRARFLAAAAARAFHHRRRAATSRRQPRRRGLRLIARGAAQAGHVESEPDLRRDAREQLADPPPSTPLRIASRRARGRRPARDPVRGPARAATRRSLSSHAISAGGSRRAGDRGSSRKISSGSSDHRSIVTSPPSSASGSTAAVPARHRHEPAVLDPAGEHRGDFRVQGLVDLLDDQRREIRGIGLEAHAAGERHQDLPRVVLLAEEPLVEPLARAVAVAHDRQRRDEEQQVDDRSARDDLQQVLLQQRVDERGAGQERDHGRARGSRARTEGCAAAPAPGRGRARRRRRRSARTPAAARAAAGTR